MHYLKIKFNQTIIRLRKKAFEPIYYAIVNNEEIVFELKDKALTRISGEIDHDMETLIVEKIKQYLIPVQEKRCRVKKSSDTDITPEDIIKELKKQGVAEKYIPEGITAVQNCLESCERTLEQAVSIIARYAASNED